MIGHFSSNFLLKTLLRWKVLKSLFCLDLEMIQKQNLCWIIDHVVTWEKVYIFYKLNRKCRGDAAQVCQLYTRVDYCCSYLN